MSVPKHNFYHTLATCGLMLVRSLILASVWIMVAGVGYLIFETGKTPFDLIFGLPLIILGGGLAITNLWSIILCIISPIYNRGVCIFCKRD